MSTVNSFQFMANKGNELLKQKDDDEMFHKRMAVFKSIHDRINIKEWT